MPENGLPAGWFALTVKPRHEKSAAQNLKLRGLEEFLPLYNTRRQWSDRTRTVATPLFPGYVFCRFSSNEWLQVVNTPGVNNVVSFGRKPEPLSDVEITAIRALVASGLPLQPWPYIQAGDRVEITGGALEGVRGIAVREKGIDRVVVNVELLQRSVAVEVDRSLLAVRSSVN